MSSQRLAKKLLLIGWDGADWQIIKPLLERGEMPALQSLIEHGVMGNMASMRPMISPMLWTTMATGKSPYHHGIHGFSEPDPNSETGEPILNLPGVR
ncbi:MAG: alkaline phosphatase family protein, partial [Planctomycetota bacterium]